MAVYRKLTVLSDSMREHYTKDLYADRESYAYRQAEKAIEDGTPRVDDQMLPPYRYGTNLDGTERYEQPFLRYYADTEGRVVSLNNGYTYYGDGMGFYSPTATIVNDDGTYVTVPAGCGGEYGADFCGSEVDVTPERKAAYDAVKAAEKKEYERQKFNSNAYDLERGRFAYVSRGRKEKGRSGIIFWYGENRWGMSVGIEDDGGQRFFTAARNVDVVPDPE